MIEVIELKVGQIVYSPKFGKGEVLSSEVVSRPKHRHDKFCFKVEFEQDILYYNPDGKYRSLEHEPSHPKHITEVLYPLSDYLTLCASFKPPVKPNLKQVIGGIYRDNKGTLRVLVGSTTNSTDIRLYAHDITNFYSNYILSSKDWTKHRDNDFELVELVNDPGELK